ncbi:variable large family protein (plasmid) [Borrelia puertoricensis]|uniref:variable large family protein n=1 Tax=Borrelia puertoricensis TaxID=2756107 RepID=UPI003EB9934C
MSILYFLYYFIILLSCRSGQQSVDAANASGAATGGNSLSSVLMDLGRSAENAFYSFLELLPGTLGFTAKSTTKKEDVGGYFNSLGAKLGEASDELEQVAKKSETELDKDGINKIIRSAVDAAKATLSTLKIHLESLGTVGDSKSVGDAETTAKQGTASDATELKKAYNSLKGMVDIATNLGVQELKAGTTTLSIDNVDNKDGAKILGTDSAATATDVSKAAVILSAVSGEEILKSIIESQENDAVVGVSSNADVNTSALKFAKGGTNNHVSNANTPKAAAVAGGIALCSLVKDGKLSAGAAANSAGGQGEVQKIGVTAANKLLGAVEDIIKKTVKNVLKTVKEKIDEARATKTSE